jgi:cell division protein FtsW
MKVAVTILVFCVAALLALGMVMLYSSSMVQAGARYLMMQLLWGLLGVGACIAATLIDYRWLKKGVWPLLIFSLVLLGLVFERHIGIKMKGSHRWVGYGALRFQPSELAKLALILALAWYGEHYQRQMPMGKRGVLVPSLFIGVVLALIFVEPDRGATILLAGVSGGMLLVAGVRWRFILLPMVMGVLGLAVSLIYDPMRTRRMIGWWHLEDHKAGVGYQAYQAMLALGAGGWTGLGLGNGRQKLGFVPEQHTDFIFSIIGEELGLIATLLVIVAFIGLMVCGIYIALHAPDTFGLLLGCGITFLIGMQAIINIGVVTSALPNKGLPLPFVSYGGSNLLMMLTCVGILLSIARTGRGRLAGPAAAEEGPPPRSRGNPFRNARTETGRSAQIACEFGHPARCWAATAPI